MFTKWWTENSSSKKTKMKQAAVISAVLVFSISSAGCSLLPDETAEEVLPPIQAPKLSEKPEYAVTTQTLETTVSGVGKLMSAREETLFFTDGTASGSESGSSGGGNILDIYVKAGDYVEAGTVIMELDTQTIEDNLRRARLDFRKNELDMKMKLREKDQYTPEEFEQFQIDFENARLEIVEMEEQIERAKLKAPFSGTIVSINVSRGDAVQAYKPVAVIADLTQLTVTAKLSQNDLQKVAPGMEAVVDINGIGSQQGTVKQLPVDNGEEQPTDPWGNPMPGNENDVESIEDYLVVELAGMPEGATRGTPLSVKVIVDRKENAVVIPPSALRTYGGRTYVQVVEEDGTKREVDVEVGQQTSTAVEIVKGLEPGQKVVGK
ncbi:efflux RND transporter periplasmic adaptor subunit [Marinicrinis lubricantis]|uniref:Efflux RND transporter periplasmic adaptor subunit n=1 Tax=Marinicrinis lubricantis TaxID=2086470 RepID=A0ABW1ISD8_9BACL